MKLPLAKSLIVFSKGDRAKIGCRQCARLERDDGEIDEKGLLPKAHIQSGEIDRRFGGSRVLFGSAVLSQMDGQAVGKASIKLQQSETTLQQSSCVNEQPRDAPGKWRGGGMMLQQQLLSRGHLLEVLWTQKHAFMPKNRIGNRAQWSLLRHVRLLK
ncbi:hypothetical protein RBB80_21215 [Tunturiibacter gelidiferens]